MERVKELLGYLLEKGAWLYQMSEHKITDRAFYKGIEDDIEYYVGLIEDELEKVIFTYEEKDYLQDLLIFANDDIGHILLKETEEQKQEKQLIKEIKEKLKKY